MEQLKQHEGKADEKNSNKQFKIKHKRSSFFVTFESINNHVSSLKEEAFWRKVMKIGILIFVGIMATLIQTVNAGNCRTRYVNCITLCDARYHINRPAWERCRDRCEQNYEECLE